MKWETRFPADKKSCYRVRALAKLKEAHKAQDIAGIDAAIDRIEQRIASCRPRLVQCSRLNKQAAGAQQCSTGCRCFTKRK